MTTKPIGGRGKTTPYHDKQVKIPLPILDDILQVRQRYWDYLAEGGDPHNPPSFIDLNSKTNTNQSEIFKYFQESLNSYLVYLENSQNHIINLVKYFTAKPNSTKYSL